MNILVTGAAGFIGYHLTQDLLRKGYHVFGIDNLNDYYDVKLKRDRIAILVKKENFHFQELDIANFDVFNAFLKKKKIEIIVNLAAQAGVRYSVKNPSAYMHSNVTGFANILEAGRANDISKIIYASSSSVYGNTNNIPFVESDNELNPLSLYAASKITNEILAKNYSDCFGMNTIGLRFFTVYGTYGRPDMAYYDFTKKIINDQEITVFNKGNMARDMTHISDIIQGVSRSVEIILNSDKASIKELINLGNNKPVKLWDLIETISRFTDKAPKYKFESANTEVDITYANIDLASKILSYNPKVDIEDGMNEFIDWFKKYN